MEALLRSAGHTTEHSSCTRSIQMSVIMSDCRCVQLVHELQGPVFPRGVPEGFKMPKGLPAKPAAGWTHHVHPAAWVNEDDAA